MAPSAARGWGWNSLGALGQSPRTVASQEMVAEWTEKHLQAGSRSRRVGFIQG